VPLQHREGHGAVHGTRVEEGEAQRLGNSPRHRALARTGAGKLYFYAKYDDGGKKCYDEKDAEQMALVKEIAGDQTLVKATAALVSKLKPAPKD
jgi:hypothetical protein